MVTLTDLNAGYCFSNYYGDFYMLHNPDNCEVLVYIETLNPYYNASGVEVEPGIISLKDFPDIKINKNDTKDQKIRKLIGKVSYDFRVLPAKLSYQFTDIHDLCFIYDAATIATGVIQSSSKQLLNYCTKK